MKMRISIFAVALIIFNSCFAFCQADDKNILEQEISSSIKSGNYCDTTQDCKIVFFGCPFGCGSYVNKDFNLQPIRDKIKEYLEKFGACDYNCFKPSEPECVNNKCVSSEELTYAIHPG